MIGFIILKANPGISLQSCAEHKAFCLLLAPQFNVSLLDIPEQVQRPSNFQLLNPFISLLGESYPLIL